MTSTTTHATQSLQADEVEIGGRDDAPRAAYLAWPLAPTVSPGVVVVHHRPGWDDWTRSVVRDLAANGLAAISPHLYWRFGPGSWDTLAAEARAAGGVADADVVQDIGVAADFIRSQPWSNGRVGLIGFCSGGRHAYLAACDLDDIDALVDCWGGRVVMGEDELDELRPRSPLSLSAGLQCPVLGIFGNDDRNPDPAQVDQVEATLVDLGVPHEFHRYDDAGHAFMNTHRDAYRPEQARAAWATIVEFLHRTLATEQTRDTADD